MRVYEENGGASVVNLMERARSAIIPQREPGWLLRAGVVGCALLAVALLVLTRVSAPNPASATALIGRPAPSFTLSAAQGGVSLPSRVRFTGTSGRPTLLVFFNTLCVHCLGEISAARQAAASAASGPLDVTFIDTPGENAQITGAYMARLRLDSPVLLDAGGAVARSYGVGYEPTLTLVDQKGVVRAVWTGETSAATLSAGIANALRA